MRCSGERSHSSNGELAGMEKARSARQGAQNASVCYMEGVTGQAKRRVGDAER